MQLSNSAETQPFDPVAPNYDAAFSSHPLGKWLRACVSHYLDRSFAEGDVVLELGCGTAVDAIRLAERGVAVIATDSSEAMLDIARGKAKNSTASERITFGRFDMRNDVGNVPNGTIGARNGTIEQMWEWRSRIHEEPRDGASYLLDGAFSNFGALNTIEDRTILADLLAGLIRPGGRLVLVTMGPLCPWEWLWYLPRGAVRTAFRRMSSSTIARLEGGSTVRVWYPTPRKLRREFAPYFRHVKTIGIGVFLPPTFARSLVERSPKFFKRLADLDRWAGRAFPGTWFNDHFLMILEREENELEPPGRRRTLSPESGYDLWAPSYGEKMNPVQIMEARELSKLLPEFKDREVLDLGCGKGRCSALALARGARRTVGVDISSAMLRAAATTVTSDRATWVKADASELPFEQEQFDVVFSSLMTGHAANLDAVVSEICRVLRPGGVALISDFHPAGTARGWTRSFADPTSGKSIDIEHYLHPIESYKRILLDHGLRIETLVEPQYRGTPLVFVIRASK